MTKPHFENRLNKAYTDDKAQHKLSESSKSNILAHARQEEHKQYSLKHLSLFQAKPALSFACTLAVVLFTYQAWSPNESYQNNLISYQGKPTVEQHNIVDNIGLIKINDKQASSVISFNEQLSKQLINYSQQLKHSKTNAGTVYNLHYANLAKHNEQWQLALCNINNNEIHAELAQLSRQTQELKSLLKLSPPPKLVEIISDEMGAIVAIRSLSPGSSKLLEQNNITHAMCSKQPKNTS